MVNYQDYTEMHGQQNIKKEDFFMCHITNYKVYNPFGAAGNFSASQEINQIWWTDVPKNFVWGFQQIQLRIEDRENRDMGAVAP